MKKIIVYGSRSKSVVDFTRLARKTTSEQYRRYLSLYRSIGALTRDLGIRTKATT